MHRDEIIAQVLAAIRAGRAIPEGVLHTMTATTTGYVLVPLGGEVGHAALRPAKARIVDHVPTKGGNQPIYQWKGTYYGFVGTPAPGELPLGVKDETLAGCRRQMVAAWSGHGQIAWYPVLVIEYATAARQERTCAYTPDGRIEGDHIERFSADVSLRVDRYWHGTLADGSHVWSHWQDTPPVTGGQRSGARATYHPGLAEKRAVDLPTQVYGLPYDDRLWNTLQDIAQRLAALGSKLKELLSSPAGVHRLLSEGQPLGLPAPAPRTEEPTTP